MSMNETDLGMKKSYYLTIIFRILSGFAGGSPLLILSTHSMPDAIFPHTVYCPFRPLLGANMIKNCELPLSGLLERAMPTVPRTNGSAENSAGISGRSEPPGAGPGRITGLGHEPVDHPVKHNAVIKSVCGQGRDLPDVLWCQVCPQINHHRPALEVHDDLIRRLCLCHC